MAEKAAGGALPARGGHRQADAVKILLAKDFYSRFFK
jgi:hypothetical protein